MEPFDEFWELYPHGRRSAKWKCRPKYAKLVKKGLHPQIMEALHLQLKAYNTKLKNKVLTKTFIADWKLSETWLNGGCWEDDVVTVKAPAIPPKNQYYSLDTEKSAAEKEKDRQQEKIHADKSWAYLAQVANKKVEDYKQEMMAKHKKKYGTRHDKKS